MCSSYYCSNSWGCTLRRWWTLSWTVSLKDDEDEPWVGPFHWHLMKCWRMTHQWRWWLIFYPPQNFGACWSTSPTATFKTCSTNKGRWWLGSLGQVCCEDRIFRIIKWITRACKIHNEWKTEPTPTLQDGFAEPRQIPREVAQQGPRRKRGGVTRSKRSNRITISQTGSS